MSERGERLPGVFRSVAACPECRGDLEWKADGAARCTSCGHSYPRGAHGQPDLRVEVWRRDAPPPPARRAPTQLEVILEPRRAAEVDYGSSRLPPNVSERFMSLVPRAPSGDDRHPAVAVDIGCGSCTCRPLLERAGYAYVGLDIADDRAPLLADAHALPLRDGVIDLAFSVAALDCLAAPPIALREIHRVLRPGGALVASVPFLTPYTEMSRVHYTHLGLVGVLTDAGFDVAVLGTGREWTGLHAIASLGLFPRMPRGMANALIAPLLALHRVWWLAGRRRVGRALPDAERLQRIAGDFEFLAVKPAE